MNFLKRFFLFTFVGIGAGMIFFASTVYADNFGIVSAQTVQARESALQESRTVKNLNMNEVVRITECDGEWYKLQLPSGAAYVLRDEIRVVQVDALISGASVNFRNEASLTSQIIGKLNTGDAVTVTSLNGDYYSVTYGGKSGFVYKDYIVSPLLRYAFGGGQAPAAGQSAQNSAAAYAVVTSLEGVNLRSGPGTENDIICVIPMNAAVDVLSISGDWLMVGHNSNIGFVKTEFLSIYEKSATGSNNVSTKGQEIVDYALRFLGTPYQWGGTDLLKGVDCSGLVYSVYKYFGIGLYRTASGMVNNGVRIGKNELAPGDLMFFDTNGGSNTGSISHVGIYIGNGNFVHASSSTRSYCVTISSLDEEYYIRTYVMACRILK